MPEPRTFPDERSDRGGPEHVDEAALLRAVVRSSPDLITLLDADGVVRWASPSAERMLGHPDGTMVGTSALDLVHPDDVPLTLEALAGTVTAEGVKVPLLVRVRRADGTFLQCEIVANNLLEEPAIAGIVVTVRDVSASMRTEAALRESEERNRLIVETAAEGVWVVDAESRTTFVNRRMAGMLGTTMDAMLGRSLFDFMDDEGRVETERNVERRRAGIAEELDFRFLRVDGSPVWTHLSTSPIPTHDGAYRGAIALVTDVTERHEMTEALRRSEARHRALVANSSDVITVLGADGDWVSSSAAGSRLLGYPEGYDPEGGIFSLLHPDDRAHAARAFAEVLDGARGPHDAVELRVLAADGTVRWFEVVGQDLLDDPAVRGVVVNARDVTERKLAEGREREAAEREAAAEARFRAAFDSSPVGIALHDLEGRVLWANAALSRITGESIDELRARPVYAESEDFDQGARLLAGEIDHYRRERFEETRDGREVWTILSVALVRDDAGAPVYVVSQHEDITDRKRLELALAHEAGHDSLTGLANRGRFFALLEEAVRLRATADGLAVLYVDLDGFKEVNDELGHGAGDELLRRVAARIRDAVRTTDVVGRLGGDEFAVLCDGLTDRRVADGIAHRIRDALAEPFPLEAGRASIGASVGLAFADDRDAEALLHTADEALYQAKRDGRGRVVVAGDAA